MPVIVGGNAEEVARMAKATEGYKEDFFDNFPGVGFLEDALLRKLNSHKNDPFASWEEEKAATTAIYELAVKLREMYPNPRHVPNNPKGQPPLGNLREHVAESGRVIRKRLSL